MTIRRHKRSAFPDIRSRLFGREGDLRSLLDRTTSSGITFVVGPENIGKSWVAKELCRRLQKDLGWLVGREESTGGGNLLLATLQDLYIRWLSDTSFREQAKILFHQRKRSFLADLGVPAAGFLATLLGEVGPWGGLFLKAVGWLHDLNRDLEEGTSSPQLLPFEQWRDMILALTWVTEPPGIALVLDSWEQEPEPKHYEAYFRKYLDALEEWPRCHVFVVICDGPHYGIQQQVAARVCRDHAEAALYTPGSITLDASEADRLWKHLCAEVPAMASLGKEHVLQALDGFPGSVERALSLGKEAGVGGFSRADLASAIKEGRESRYSELGELIPERDPREIALMARVALLPAITSEEQWESLRLAIDAEIPVRDAELLIASLKQSRILDGETPWPSFGHPARCKAARDLFIDALLPYVATEAKGLLLSLAAHTKSYTEEFGPYILAAVDLSEPIERARLGPQLHALTLAARTLRPGQDGLFVPSDPQIWQAWSTCARQYPETAPIVGMALVNLIAGGPWEGRADAYDIQQGILTEIRALKDRYPDEPALRMTLAKSLFTFLFEASEQRFWRDCITAVEELRALASTYPDEKMIVRMLPLAVWRLTDTSRPEEEVVRRDPYFRELVSLSSDPFVLDAVRDAVATEPESVAAVFASTLAVALALNIGGAGVLEGDTESQCQAYRRPDRDALLEELRALATRDPRNRSAYCWALYFVMDGARLCDDMQTYMRLFEDLRSVSRPLENTDPILRDKLATAHFEVLQHTNDDEAALPPLLALHLRHPDDRNIRDQLGNALVYVLIFSDGPLAPTKIREITKTLDSFLVSGPDNSFYGFLARGLLEAWLRQLHHREHKSAGLLATELLSVSREHFTDDLRASTALEIALAVAERAAAEKDDLCDSLLVVMRRLCAQHRDVDGVVPKGDMAFQMSFLYRWDATDPSGSEERLQLLRQFHSDFSPLLPHHDGGPETGIAPPDSCALMHAIGRKYPVLVKKSFRMLADELLEHVKAGRRDMAFSPELRQVTVEVMSHAKEVR